MIVILCLIVVVAFLVWFCYEVHHPAVAELEEVQAPVAVKSELEVLQDAFKSRGWSFAELARESGLSYTHTKYVMLGKRKLTSKTRKALADALLCDIL